MFIVEKPSQLNVKLMKLTMSARKREKQRHYRQNETEEMKAN